MVIIIPNFYTALSVGVFFSQQAGTHQNKQVWGERETQKQWENIPQENVKN